MLAKRKKRKKSPVDILTTMSKAELEEVIQAITPALLGRHPGLNIVMVNPHVEVHGAVMDKKQRIKVTRSSNIGSIGSARDVTTFNQRVEASSLDSHTKDALRQARQCLEDLDVTDRVRDDAVTQLDNLAAELESAERDVGLLATFFGRIKAVAPKAAALLGTIADIKELGT